MTPSPKKDGGPETFCGYTHSQIIEMDRWFKSNALSWEILGERYKQGFEAGVTAQREIIDQHLKDLADRLRSQGEEWEKKQK